MDAPPTGRSDSVRDQQTARATDDPVSPKRRTQDRIVQLGDAVVAGCVVGGHRFFQCVRAWVRVLC